jgi:hypothetical protein
MPGISKENVFKPGYYTEIFLCNFMFYFQITLRNDINYVPERINSACFDFPPRKPVLEQEFYWVHWHELFPRPLP